MPRRVLTSHRLSAFVATLLAATAAIGIARRHRRVSAAAPELRRPQLYLPLAVRDDASLRVMRRLMARFVPGPSNGVRVEHVPATADRPAVRLLVEDPPGRARPSGALVWIHGGGLVMGIPEQSADLCGRLAAEAGAVVVSVDYRLAPEDPFPAGLDDCAAALEWTHANADALGIDPDRIAVGGESAGGGLAACLAQVALDRGGPPICFQLLQYPMLDDRTATRNDLDALVWTNASNRYAWSAYLGHPVTRSEVRPYASAARRDDLKGLPPAWIGVGDIDLFHDECADYAHRLRAAGVTCELDVVPGMYHGADRMAPDAPSMQDFVDGMVAALRRATS